MKFSYFLEIVKSYRQDLRFCRHTPIKIFNFWSIEQPEQIWFHQFIKGKRLLPRNQSVSVYSVFGDRAKMKLDVFRPKIFYTGENSFYRRNYADHCLKDVDLSLGSEYIAAPNYFRFPLWYLYFIKAHFTYRDVEAWINEVELANNLPGLQRNRFCCLVAGHDPLGYRKGIFDLLSPISHVDSGGRFLKNTDDLHQLYKDDKIEFIKNYKFHICPENSNASGYVTEKIFYSLIAGCLPIYWGSDLSPEPDILNQQRILFYDPNGSNKLFNEVSDLANNRKLFVDYYMQNIFKAGAAEIVYDRLVQLENKIKAIF